VIKLEVGFDFSRTPDSSDIVLYSEFETRAALDAYQAHPLHAAVKPIVMVARDKRRLVDHTSADQGESRPTPPGCGDPAKRKVFAMSDGLELIAALDQRT